MSAISSTRSNVPRPGRDPLTTPDLLARVALAAMSAHHDTALVLLDRRWVGHLVVVVDGGLDALADHLTVVAEAIDGTFLCRVAVVHRERGSDRLSVAVASLVGGEA